MNKRLRFIALFLTLSTIFVLLCGLGIERQVAILSESIASESTTSMSYNMDIAESENLVFNIRFLIGMSSAMLLALTLLMLVEIHGILKQTV